MSDISNKALDLAIVTAKAVNNEWKEKLTTMMMYKTVTMLEVGMMHDTIEEFYIKKLEGMKKK